MPLGGEKRWSPLVAKGPEPDAELFGDQSAEANKEDAKTSRSDESTLKLNDGDGDAVGIPTDLDIDKAAIRPAEADEPESEIQAVAGVIMDPPEQLSEPLPSATRTLIEALGRRSVISILEKAVAARQVPQNEDTTQRTEDVYSEQQLPVEPHSLQLLEPHGATIPNTIENPDTVDDPDQQQRERRPAKRKRPVADEPPQPPKRTRRVESERGD